MNRGRAIQVNDKGVNPMRDPDSAIKPPPASLPDLEAELQELLACRPSNKDLPALATWNEQKSRLQFWIDLAKSSAVAPVFVRGDLSSQPVHLVLADEVDSYPKPTTTPSAEVSPVVHQTIHPKARGRSPQEVLDYKIEKIAKDTAALQQATDSASFKRMRNLVHQDRCDARRHATLKGLAMPDLPPLPANPFATAKPKPAAPAAASSSIKTAVKAPNPKRVAEALRAATVPSSSSGAAAVHAIRASIWSLAADLERMPAAQRAALQPELALLDAAAHAVHNLAKGQLEVM